MLAPVNWPATRPKNAIDVTGRTPEDIGGIGPIRHEAAINDELPVGGNDRHTMFLCRLHDRLARTDYEDVRSGDQTTARSRPSSAIADSISATLRTWIACTSTGVDCCDILNDRRKSSK